MLAYHLQDQKSMRRESELQKLSHVIASGDTVFLWDLLIVEQAGQPWHCLLADIFRMQSSRLWFFCGVS